MCTILFSHKNHPRFQLILISNRDEYYIRPTTPLGFWDDTPHILAGRDRQNNGTWLGITKAGRIAAITNFRKPSAVKADAPSRGLLVSDFLNGDDTPDRYLQKISETGSEFNPFNLIVGDPQGLFYYSNMGNGIEEIVPGIHGLSNDLLNTPWPKVRDGKTEFKKHTIQDTIDNEKLFHLLRDTTCPPDEELPETGVGIQWERILAPIFIKSEIYGTRASSIILITKTGEVTFIERTYEPVNPSHEIFEEETRMFTYRIASE